MSGIGHHGSTQQWPLLHREDYLQGFLLACWGPARAYSDCRLHSGLNNHDAPLLTTICKPGSHDDNNMYNTVQYVPRLKRLNNMYNTYNMYNVSNKCHVQSYHDVHHWTKTLHTILILNVTQYCHGTLSFDWHCTIDIVPRLISIFDSKEIVG